MDVNGFGAGGLEESGEKPAKVDVRCDCLDVGRLPRMYRLDALLNVFSSDIRHLRFAAAFEGQCQSGGC